MESITQSVDKTVAGARPAVGKSDSKVFGVYIRSIITQKVYLHITEVGTLTKRNIELKLISSNEGRCTEYGYIRPQSVRILTYSSGLVNGDKIRFDVTLECMICNPVEGMLMESVVKTITKAGIHSEVITDGIVPVTVFVARDHHNTNTYFNSIKDNDKIITRVIGVRYELNDPYICVIAQLENPATSADKQYRQRQRASLAKIDVTDIDAEIEEDE